jgi:hypothetical protein
MTSDLLQKFEQAVTAWNPLLARKLQPGLPEMEIRGLLRRHKVGGDLGPVPILYGWRNGAKLDAELVASKRGFFPAAKPYYLLDLEMAVGHLDHTRIVARRRPELQAGSVLLPLFWDGSTGWIAVDLGSVHHGRVILSEHRAETPFRDSRACLEDLLNDAIRAIETGAELSLDKQ